MKMPLRDWTGKLLGYSRKKGKRLPFAALFSLFQEILSLNNQVLELMADMGDKLGGDYVFDRQYIQSSCQRMSDLVHKLIYNLNGLAPMKYPQLNEAFRRINHEIEEELAGRLVIPKTNHVIRYEFITRDFADVVGSKNANIAELKNKLDLQTPDGFAITTRAYQSFLEYNNLSEKISEATKDWTEGVLSAKQASDAIQSLLLSGTVPPEVRKAIDNALLHLQELTGHKHLYLAIRSSAKGEDTEHTFAGQYASMLNEPQGNILHCYKKILASAYSPFAMEYRFEKGFHEHEVPMAVACQTMVNASKSGVLYTLDPLNPERDVLLITATWGLGAPVVSGKVRADQYSVSRKPPHETEALDIVRKTESLVVKKGGGCKTKPIPEELQTQSCLSDKEIRLLAKTGLLIEKYLIRPQDIEWVFDEDGTLVILQARPLNIVGGLTRMVKDISTMVEGYPVIFAQKGVIAQNGVGSGEVFLVKDNEDLERFPQGAILVARQTSPRFAEAVKKANGIITDIGSPTGHMATIAREFKVPTIVDTGIATDTLTAGQLITVDADDNVVYEGIVRELLYYQFAKETFEETYEYRLLRRVLKRISPLNLLDPHSGNFVPHACRTFHDITRFIHEKAVQELLDINYYHQRDSDAPGRKLESEVPLDLIVIDIGGGLAKETGPDTVRIDEIVSIPMRAFLSGLNMPGFWSSEPMAVDFGSFMSSLTRTFSSSLASPTFIGQNLAVISEAYVNINLRLGYHFNMIDAYIGDNINDNYAYFRFLGGVTDQTRRSRRVKFIAEILAKQDFRVELRGDLVVGRIKKLAPEIMEKKIHIIGQLVAFTRQLDVKMDSDLQIDRFLEEFDQLTKNNGRTSELEEKA